jgi:ferredoxin
MATWFLRGLRRGVVTTRYPNVIDHWATSLPTPPLFHPRRLTAELCDRMAEICPSSALARDEHMLIFDVGACSACGRCLAVAGDAAGPSGIFELATTDRSHLVKRVPIGGDSG